MRGMNPFLETMLTQILLGNIFSQTSGILSRSMNVASCSGITMSAALLILNKLSQVLNASP